MSPEHKVLSQLVYKLEEEVKKMKDREEKHMTANVNFKKRAEKMLSNIRKDCDHYRRDINRIERRVNNHAVRLSYIKKHEVEIMLESVKQDVRRLAAHNQVLTDMYAHENALYWIGEKGYSEAEQVELLIAMAICRAELPDSFWRSLREKTIAEARTIILEESNNVRSRARMQCYNISSLASAIDTLKPDD